MDVSQYQNGSPLSSITLADIQAGGAQPNRVQMHIIHHL